MPAFTFRAALARAGSLGLALIGISAAQTASVSHPDLEVRTVLTGLTTPTAMSFLGPNDFFVIEKNTGQVKRVRQGVVSTVLDLGVNFASERGLLGIALSPRFSSDGGVYLFWTCRATMPPPNQAALQEQRCLDQNMFLPDTNVILQVPLLGHRVDRFVWNGTSLNYDRNLIMLRAYQADGVPLPQGLQGDESQPPRGNHNGGVIVFGPDGKLYIIFGDQGRRGQMQNLAAGPTPPLPDDQFGGPQPDDAHLAGVVLRLNADGSAPTDNPFYQYGAQVGGEVGRNLQKVFAYGIRNSFGMEFDPHTGYLWETEHGDDTFDEINRIEAGHNGGWVQIMGPVSRIAEFKAIETSPQFFGLQQLRWPPTNLANTPGEALSRLFTVPGSHYADPSFSWRYATLPVALNFAPQTFGQDLARKLIVGMSAGAGHLFAFDLSGNRRDLVFQDPRLADRVADNNAKLDLTESESLLIGSGFGILTDIERSPTNTLYLVSLSQGAIYELSKRSGSPFGENSGTGKPLVTRLTGAIEIPIGDPDGTGIATFRLNSGQGEICYEISVQNIATATAAHIHPGALGQTGPALIPLMPPSSGSSSGCVAVSRDLVKQIRDNPQAFYVNVHNAQFPQGAVRGQLSGQ
jgi:aldose sugar dehydrogenase